MAEEIICGRVAYDVENDEWVMFIEDKFVSMVKIYQGINEELIRNDQPLLKVGDEISITLKRS
jgi:hypothetical protein